MKLQKDVARCAREAAKVAVERYMEISGGKTIHDHGIETFVSSKIAEAAFEFGKHRGATATLETTFAEVWNLSGARKGRAADRITPKSRFDVCYFEHGKPVGIIEVKKRFAAFKGENDVNRLLECLRRFGNDFGGSVKFGVWIAVQRVGDGATATAESQMDRFKKSFKWQSIEPETECLELEGDFGTLKRSGRQVSGIRVYSVAFESPKDSDAAE